MGYYVHSSNAPRGEAVEFGHLLRTCRRYCVAPSTVNDRNSYTIRAWRWCGHGCHRSRSPSKAQPCIERPCWYNRAHLNTAQTILAAWEEIRLGNATTIWPTIPQPHRVLDLRLCNSQRSSSFLQPLTAMDLTARGGVRSFLVPPLARCLTLASRPLAAWRIREMFRCSRVDVVLAPCISTYLLDRPMS